MSQTAPNTETVTANEAETRLLESALKLFAYKGYAGTSIREIIEAAGVTRPVLYYYFQNKEDLFTRLVETRFSELVAMIEHIKDTIPDCAGRLKAILGEAFARAEDKPDPVNLLLQVFFAPPMQGPSLDRVRLAHHRFRHIEDIMRDGLERNEICGGDAQSLALVFLGMMDMHFMAKSNRAETRLSRELGEGLVDLFLGGASYKVPAPAALVSPYAN